MSTFYVEHDALGYWYTNAKTLFYNNTLDAVYVDYIEYYAKINAYTPPVGKPNKEVQAKLRIRKWDKDKNLVMDTETPVIYTTSTEVQYLNVSYDLGNKGVFLAYGEEVDITVYGSTVGDSYNTYLYFDCTGITKKNIYAGDYPYPAVIEDIFEGYCKLTFRTQSNYKEYQGGYYIAEPFMLEPFLPYVSQEPHMDMSWYINPSVLDGYPVMRWMKEQDDELIKMFVWDGVKLLPADLYTNGGSGLIKSKLAMLQQT